VALLEPELDDVEPDDVEPDEPDPDLSPPEPLDDLSELPDEDSELDEPDPFELLADESLSLSLPASLPAGTVLEPFLLSVR
jgi:hypothetical protein